ncbi:hypothetical protein SteCoe_7681 [Stentor coeruleus]|uniref:RING-type domain-containing protein n=1 Tax=Stentor coeruleus TaxID=5963 RepID=A0A1R2CM19_9CILI|nr:hypothetical protein SteCoe_7681 [Stentor coeruleus]
MDSTILSYCLYFAKRYFRIIYFSYTLILMIFVLIFPSYAKLILILWFIILLILITLQLIILLYYRDPQLQYTNIVLATINPSFYRFSITSTDEFDNFALHKKPSKKLGLCVICLDNICINQMIYELDCKHFFHSKCCKKWFKIKPVCPTCKHVLSFK